MWAYLHFIFFIWEQDKDDDDGLEYYVRNKINIKEITWFPMNKAMRLEQVETQQEALTNKLRSSVSKTRSNFDSKLGGLQSEVGNMLEMLSHLLKESQGGLRGMQMGGTRGGDGQPVGEEDEATEWYPALGYNVFVSIKELRGVDVPTDELSLLMCRVISDSGIYSVDRGSVAPAKKACSFDGVNFLVYENAQPHDKTSTFQIQILLGTSFGASKFVAVVEVSVSDILFCDSEATIEKSFQKMGQVSECTIVLRTSWVKALKFTRGDDDKD